MKKKVLIVTASYYLEITGSLRTEAELLSELKKNFMRVIHVKPKASRKESSELYVIALGFKPNA